MLEIYIVTGELLETYIVTSELLEMLEMLLEILLSYAWFIFSCWFMMKEEIPIKNGEEEPSSWMSKSEVAAE